MTPRIATTEVPEYVHPGGIMSGFDPAVLGIGGPTSAAWREEALARVEGLRFLERWLRQHPKGASGAGGGGSIERHLAAAQDAAADDRPASRIARVWTRNARSPFERALANLDTAEIDLLRLAPEQVLQGALPSIQAHVNRYLAKDDPRRMCVDRIIKPEPVALSERERELLLNALFAANTQRRRNLARVRSFRDMLRGGILTAFVLAITLGWIGYSRPEAIPLCFTPENDGKTTLACPQAMTSLGDTTPGRDIDRSISATVKHGDIMLVEFVGLLGAALSVAALLRNLKRGTATPYNVPRSLAILKLPTGALTAVAGLLLMRADFVPGLSALDTPAQILGWALVFGIAQQLVTRLADSQAHNLLEDVGGRGAAGDRPLMSGPSAPRAPAG
jgi:hypothetical protein